MSRAEFGCCVGCGVALTRDEFSDRMDECGPCAEFAGRHEAPDAPEPAAEGGCPELSQPEAIAQAVTELRELARLLNGRQAPIVDAVPFALRRQVDIGPAPRPKGLPFGGEK